jgi:hypothetical protein
LGLLCSDDRRPATVTYTTVANDDDGCHRVVTDILPWVSPALTVRPQRRRGRQRSRVTRGRGRSDSRKSAAPATPTAVSVVRCHVDPATALATMRTSHITATQAGYRRGEQHVVGRPRDLRIGRRPERRDRRQRLQPNQGDTITSSSGLERRSADATNVVVKDVLPTGLKYVSCTPCRVAFADSRLSPLRWGR